MTVSKRNLLLESLFSGDMFNFFQLELDQLKIVSGGSPRYSPQKWVHEVSEYRPVGLQRGDYTMELVPDG